MFNKQILMLALSVGSLVLPQLWAQQTSQPSPGSPASEPVAAKRVRSNLYQVGGGVGNAFFYIGSDEVLVIDAKISADAARQLLAEIKRV
jgi:hypothetical protein